MKKYIPLLIFTFLFACGSDDEKIKELDKNNVKGQDLHIKAPSDKVIDYDVRIKEQVTSVRALSNDGLLFQLELSYRYQALPGNAEYIEENELIIAEQIRFSTREVTGYYSAEELYSTAIHTIEGQIFEMLKPTLDNEYDINLDAILIRDLTLPPALVNAIEKKQAKKEELEKELKQKNRNSIH